jgi:hypothetical protein
LATSSTTAGCVFWPPHDLIHTRRDAAHVDGHDSFGIGRDLVLQIHGSILSEASTSAMTGTAPEAITAAAVAT